MLQSTARRKVNLIELKFVKNCNNNKNEPQSCKTEIFTLNCRLSYLHWYMSERKKKLTGSSSFDGIAEFSRRNILWWQQTTVLRWHITTACHLKWPHFGLSFVKRMCRNENAKKNTDYYPNRIMHHKFKMSNVPGDQSAAGSFETVQFAQHTYMNHAEITFTTLNQLILCWFFVSFFFSYQISCVDNNNKFNGGIYIKKRKYIELLKHELIEWFNECRPEWTRMNAIFWATSNAQPQCSSQRKLNRWRRDAERIKSAQSNG